MAHPINKRNFGSTANTTILIRYHNGTSAVTGYIVKQLGTDKFRVTTNGTAMFDVRLAQTTSAAGTLTAGFCTIRVTPHGGSAENVRRLLSRKAYTTQGSVVSWQYADTASAGQGAIEKNA